MAASASPSPAGRPARRLPGRALKSCGDGYHGCVSGPRTALLVVLAFAGAACVGGQGSSAPSGPSRPGSAATSPAGSGPFPACVKPASTGATVNESSHRSVALSLTTRRVVGRGFNSVVVDPAGDRVLVMDDVRGSIAIVDGASLRVAARITVGRSRGAAGLALDPTTGLVYVVRASGMVSVINPEAASVVREARFEPLETVGDVYAAAVAGGKLWVAHSEAGLLVLDLETLQVVPGVGSWPEDYPPVDLVVDPSRPLVYVSSADRLAVISTATNQVVRCLRTGGRLGLDPERNMLYVASTDSDSGALLRVIDGVSMDVVATVRGGLVPVDVEVDPRAGRVYVVDAGAYNAETVDADAGLVWVVDTRSNRLRRTLAIGISPTAATLSAKPSAMFVTTYDGTLSRLPLPQDA